MPKNVIQAINCSLLADSFDLVIHLLHPEAVVLLYSEDPPVVTPEFRVNRGVLEECGFSIRLLSATCLTEIGSPATSFHAWQAFVNPLVPTIYWIVADNCDSGLATWSSAIHTCSREVVSEVPIAARVFRSSTQSIPVSAFVAISFDTIGFDLASLWAPGTPTRLTAPVPGVYSFGGTVEWADKPADDVNLVRLLKNGVEVSAELADVHGANVAVTPNYAVNAIDQLIAGDFVELVVLHASAAGARLILADATERASLWMSRIT